MCGLLFKMVADNPRYQLWSCPKPSLRRKSDLWAVVCASIQEKKYAIEKPSSDDCRVCSLRMRAIQRIFTKRDNKRLTELPRQYTATAFGQAGSIGGKSFGVNIYINAWTTDQQVQDFITALKEKGPDGLVKAMEKTPDVGRLSPTGFVGSGFRFARYRPTVDGGLHIVMVTTRPMSFGELYRGGRSLDYQFRIVVLNVDKTGKGTGTLAPVCKIRFKKKRTRGRKFRPEAFPPRKRLSAEIRISLEMVAVVDDFRTFVAHCDGDNRGSSNGYSRS
jgi:hypothetical protein